MKVHINFLKEQMNYIVEAAASAKLEKNFELGELANTAGNKSLPMYEVNIYSVLLVKMLQELRDKVNTRIIVNSGYRQEAYNRKIGGDKNSGHLRAWAVDIQKINAITDESMVIYWKSICYENTVIGAINLYDGYYHLEICSDKLYGNKNFEVRDKRSKKK